MKKPTLYSAGHLDRQGIIESGSFYTPRGLVDEVGAMIAPALKENQHRGIVIFDSSAGGGAFTLLMDQGTDYRLADRDCDACRHLARFADSTRIYQTNSLHEVCREKFDIPADVYLIMVGNPPYNDITSAYKKGEKGCNDCDPDLRDRDLGISFLRSYDKLGADEVCVLHPLAYLIKESNFKRLRGFAQNYRLRDAVIFSSDLFPGTAQAKFPIMIGHYERQRGGMDYGWIREYPFRIQGKNKTFRLSRFETSDGYIGKYPPRKNEPKESPIGLYFYTFRDINSLRRSATFQTEPHPNAIVVTPENLYQYCYLFAFKTLFRPDEPWLYGNLSPLADREWIERNQRRIVGYALARHPAFARLPPAAIEAIRLRYHLYCSSERYEGDDIEGELREHIARLIQ